MDKDYVTLDDPDHFERVVTPHGIGYRTKRYPGPIAIDALPPISLGEGQDPPAGKINPDYKEQPNNPRKCVECGKLHDTVWEDSRTGERIEELSKCKDCLLGRIWKDEELVQVTLDHDPLPRTENHYRKMAQDLKESQKLYNQKLSQATE